MALTACPECRQQVSDTAYRCNHCGYQIRQAKRGLIGQLFKWAFILFNILMVWWLFAYWGDVNQMMSETSSDGGRAGMAIGSTMATGMIIMTWALGDVILGMLVFFTRPKES